MGKLTVVTGVLLILLLVACSPYPQSSTALQVQVNVLATVGCAAGTALPGTMLAVFALLKRAENGKRRQPETQYTQPVVTVVPPMALPQPQQAPPAAATWETVAMRHFTVVGDE